MKNPRKNEPALSDRLLEVRFVEKKRGLGVFFRHEVPILAGCRAVGPLCTVGLRGEIALGLRNLASLLEGRHLA
jgi:hypothetical protein